jgi:hypothetical protein
MNRASYVNRFCLFDGAVNLSGSRRFAIFGGAPLPVADFRQVFAVLIDVLLVLD